MWHIIQHIHITSREITSKRKKERSHMLPQKKEKEKERSHMLPQKRKKEEVICYLKKRRKKGHMWLCVYLAHETYTCVKSARGKGIYMYMYICI